MTHKLMKLQDSVEYLYGLHSYYNDINNDAFNSKPIIEIQKIPLINIDNIKNKKFNGYKNNLFNIKNIENTSMNTNKYKKFNDSVSSYKVNGNTKISNMFLGRIYFYQILRNPKTGKYIYLIGESHSHTTPIKNINILSMTEFLQFFTKIHEKENEKLIILTEGRSNNVPNYIKHETNNNDVYIKKLIDVDMTIYKGTLHVEDYLKNIISTDLRDYIIRLYVTSLEPNNKNNTFIDRLYNDSIIDEEKTHFINYVNINIKAIIKKVYSFLDEEKIDNYLKHKDDKYIISNIISNLFVVELVADLLIDYFNTEHNNINLIYYAHFGHINMVYSQIIKHYTEIIYSYNANFNIDKDYKNSNNDFIGYKHCKRYNIAKTQYSRKSDQKFLVNITPYLIQPYEQYFNELLPYYDKTVERKNLDKK